MSKNHSPEYTRYITSPEWREKSIHCQSLTGNRCVLMPWLPSNHSHHMTYKNMGNEKPGRDIVPLSKKAHEWVHHPLLWKNRNIRMFVNLGLRAQYYGTRLSFVAGQMVGWERFVNSRPKKKK